MTKLVILLFLAVVSCRVVKKREVGETEELSKGNEEISAVNDAKAAEVGAVNKEEDKKTEEKGSEQKDIDNGDKDKEKTGDDNNGKSDTEPEKLLERREENEEGKETENKEESKEPEEKEEQGDSKTENKDEECDDNTDEKKTKEQSSDIMYLMPLMSPDQITYPFLVYDIQTPVLYLN